MSKFRLLVPFCSPIRSLNVGRVSKVEFGCWRVWDTHGWRSQQLFEIVFGLTAVMT